MENEQSNRKVEIHSFVQKCHEQSWPSLNTITDEDAEKIVYPGEDYHWSVRNLLSHLADSERGMLGQIQRAVEGKMTVPDDFDLERWNRSVARKNASTQITEFLDRILAAYKDELGFLDSLEEDQLDIQGRHSSGDFLTIEGYFRLIAQHRLDHVQDVMRVLDRE